jgi:hypothetical protein
MKRLFAIAAAALTVFSASAQTYPVPSRFPSSCRLPLEARPTA